MTTPDPQKMNRWQPIATAPKDGTRLVFAIAGTELAAIGFWWLEDESSVGHWFVPSWDAKHLSMNPTHWMPLPDPPLPDVSEPQQEKGIERMKEELGLSRSDQSGNREPLTHAATTETVSDKAIIAELVKLLEQIKAVVDRLPIDAMGTAGTDDADWPIRDEMSDSIQSALTFVSLAAPSGATSGIASTAASPALKANSQNEIPDIAGTEPRLSILRPPNLADAAEMLWTVVANVSGGDWSKQSPEWQEAAARWRDYYFSACPEMIGSVSVVEGEASAPHAKERSAEDPLSSSSITIDEAREALIAAIKDNSAHVRCNGSYPTIIPNHLIDHLIAVVLASREQTK